MKNILIILFLSISVAVGATTYYIGPSGSDSNNGSSSSPWKTLAYACSKVTTSGDIIHVNAGSYTETSQCVLATGVSIEGVGDASHIIFSYNSIYPEYAAIQLHSGSAGTNGNQTISYLKLDGNNYTSSVCISVTKRSNVTIDHCTIVNFLMAGICFRGDCVKASGFTPGETGTPPSVYEHNNTVSFCTIDNCAAYSSNVGLIHIDSQTEITIHDCTLTQNSRPGNDGDIIDGWGGYFKGLDYYNNVSRKPVASSTKDVWNFHFEVGTTQGGNNIHNNQFLGGGIALDIAATVNVKGAYNYSWWIHDNHFEADRRVASTEVWHASDAILLESSCQDYIINNNYIKNFAYGLRQIANYDGYKQTNGSIYYNIFENIGFTDSQWAFVIWAGSNAEGTNAVVSNLSYYNNVFKCNGAEACFGFLTTAGSAKISNIKIKNNIIQDIGSYGWMYVHSGSGSIDNVDIQNNIVNNVTKGTSIYYNSGAPSITNLTNKGYITSDPSFVSSTDFHLQSNSPAINAGVNVGLLTDFTGINRVSNPPEIGVYESGSSLSAPVLPVYQSSVVENANPSMLEMTYDLSLASISPAASSFLVSVNSVARPVSSVVISGTKIQLTIASPVVTGDVITVSYTKPASNPVQTTSGGLAATISAQTVTNNVITVSPVYVSSLVGNVTPAMLEMTYSITLASKIPAPTAFSVLVNSVIRTVNSVAIAGTKVQLTLASAIKYGDIVTVAYTKPATNPLQNSSGVAAPSISAQSVINNLVNPVKDAPVTVTLTISPNHVHKIINIILAYSSTPTSAFSPEIIRISDLLGTLLIEKVLVTGATNVRIPQNLNSGIYNVTLSAGGAVLAVQRMRVY
jgi:uncharacterized repeat protein (TIGR02059 family)